MKSTGGKQQLAIEYSIDGSAVVPKGIVCLLKIVPPNMQAAVHLLTDQLAAVSADFVSSGKIEAVENQYLHEWFGGLADGTVTVASEQ